MDFISHYSSPLGDLTLASDGESLVGIYFEKHRYSDKYLDVKQEIRDDLPVFDETRRWLDMYFGGQVPDFTPKLLLRTTPFRRRVCEIMLTIPYGQTMSYGEIARLVARERGVNRMSAQAVGGAVGHNKIPIIIPCHRVIGSDGSMVGYGGGLDKKEFLLKLEGIL